MKKVAIASIVHRHALCRQFDIESKGYRVLYLGAQTGYRKDGVTVSRKATGGKGELYVPALDATFMVSWSLIGTYHLDIRPDSEGREIIVSHFGFTKEDPGNMDQWSKNRAWEPVEAYLKSNGDIVAGSVNLMLHSGSGATAKLNVTSGTYVFTHMIPGQVIE